MSTKLATVVADFTTQLATAMAIGATSVSLQSATDDDGNALPNGVYFFALDGNNSQKEHIVATLAGTSLTGISSVSRQGVQVSGCVRTHRVGSTVTLTDFAHLRYINDLLSGATNFNASVPLGYDGTASITTANQFATKAYVDGVAVAGAPNASSTVKGIVQEATQAQVLAKTAAGSTGAELYVNPLTMPSTLLSDYKLDTGAANAYVITPAPAITAYTVGQIFSFKAANANTIASTLNVNALGTKAIVNSKGGALVSGDIASGMIVMVEYDGTSMVMQVPTANAPTALEIPSQTSKSGDFLSTDGSNPFWAIPLANGTIADNTNVAIGGANTDTVVTHGLGRTPTLVRISAVIFARGSVNGNAWGFADYNSSGVMLSSFTTFDGTTTAGNGGATNMTGIASGNPSAQITVSVISIGATTFTFRITGATLIGSPANSSVTKIVWECR